MNQFIHSLIVAIEIPNSQYIDLLDTSRLESVMMDL